MTLHWWMHWFWITCHCTFGILLTHSIPLSPMATVPSSMDKIKNYTMRKSVQPTISKSDSSLTLPFSKTSGSGDTTSSEQTSQIYKTKDNIDINNLCSNYIINITTTQNSTNGLKNDTRLPCELNYINVTDNIYINDTSLKDMNLSTETSTTSDLKFTTKNNSNKDVIINATLTSVILPKDNVKTEISDNVNATSTYTLTAGSIAGISLSVLVFGVFVAVASLLLYRRRYINKLQTLNDKCSNPDSSGYIDDTTIRENSEEMYSLDNDSFLNSLEAMTIQNYWTDSVKHTKL